MKAFRIECQGISGVGQEYGEAGHPGQHTFAFLVMRWAAVFTHLIMIMGERDNKSNVRPGREKL